MDEIGKALATYAKEVTDLAGSPGSTEATFYPAIHRFLSVILKARNLPFDVRTNTSQRRSGGGTDLPDIAFYESEDYPVVYGEVKTAAVDLDDLAQSTERNDQIGRYLATTGVVLLANVRAFGLLAVEPGYTADGPVPPAHRRLLDVVELWPSATALTRGKAPDIEAGPVLAELVETAVTEFAPIAEPESLARILARQARRAKADLPKTFSSAVQPLMADFSKALGLTFEGPEGEEFLRSSLIQTVFYGLFASWTLWHHSGEPREFRWRDLGEYLKIPFLGALFHEFRHPTRIKELGLAPHLDRATATLHRVDHERFFGRFTLPHVVSQNGGDSTATHAILYFYEPFLEAFDPELRKELGVWYTPQEIVRYQVRKVDRLLRDELDCPRGFADDRVVVLDPCCGTGAYLLEVVRCTAEQLESEGAGAMLASKLLHAVCHRVLGFEILTAPFVVAQLQLYLILSEMGVEPDESHRPAIFLTNALTGWDGTEQLKLQFPELQQEHDAAQQVKREARIIVILGNPPYNRFVGAPMAEEQELADHYKGLQREKGQQLGNTALFERFGIRKHLLDDLYIRFFRLAEVRIGEEAEYGVVSWISNSSYLAGRSHPLMRESLLKNFDCIWIDNLNGDKYATGKIIPKGLPGAGTSDQSVFTTAQDPRGIQVGTAISTLLKSRPGKVREVAQVWHRDFWGRSLAKRESLVASLMLESLPVTEREELAVRPEGPRAYEPVTPTANDRWKLVPLTITGGYEEWPSLTDLFPHRYQGVNPARGLEGSVVDTDSSALADRMKAYYSALPFAEFQRLHPTLTVKRARYEPEEVREYLQANSGFDPDRLVDYVLFPLDARYIYYETDAKLLTERSPKLWENLRSNLFLVALPHARRASETKPLAATTLFDYHLHDHGAFGFPARFKPEQEPRNLFSDQDPQSLEPRANVAPTAWQGFKDAWRLEGDLRCPEALAVVYRLFYISLAVGHSPAYQHDHQDALAHDWLHLPIPKDHQVLEEIALLGEQVATLLDPMTEPARVLQAQLGTDLRTLAVPTKRGGGALREEDLTVTISYFGAARGGWEERAPREKEASDPAWGESTGDLALNDVAYLANVPAKVWQYELGGYPVIKKWLGYRDQKRRPGRPLTHEELDHLRGMVHRIAALIRLHEELDKAYERAIDDAFTAEELGL